MPLGVAVRLGQTLELRDGRTLGYSDVGLASGRPLVLFHGTPSSRLDATWLDEPAERTGWRLIAPDRPGIGLSSPGAHSLVDVVRDVEALVDALGVDRFAVLGYSGGAPFALATAQQLRERVDVVGLASPWGPPDRPGAYAGVSLTERLSDAAARHVPALTRAMFFGVSTFLRFAPSQGARAVARRLDTHDGDPSVATPDSLRPTTEVLAPIREAFRQGSSGPTHDLQLIVRPWGFAVEDVDVPVRLWHGDHDAEIPLHHATHLASAVADGELHVLPGEDHLALYRHADEILGDLAAAVPRDGLDRDEVDPVS
jgi:pimeloyl-ACP methyl ester carboxylesterase